MKKFFIFAALFSTCVFAGYLDDQRLDSSRKLFPDSGGAGLDSSRYLVPQNKDYDDRNVLAPKAKEGTHGIRKAFPNDREPIIKSRPY